jgi:hypothetical protein
MLSLYLCVAESPLLTFEYRYVVQKQKTKLGGFSPQANYT